MLTGKDAALLKKLAPEFDYGSSQIPFGSVLPPLSNHFSEDVKDFENNEGCLMENSRILWIW